MITEGLITWMVIIMCVVVTILLAYLTIKIYTAEDGFRDAGKK